MLQVLQTPDPETRNQLLQTLLLSHTLKQQHNFAHTAPRPLEKLADPVSDDIKCMIMGWCSLRLEHWEQLPQFWRDYFGAPKEKDRNVVVDLFFKRLLLVDASFNDVLGPSLHNALTKRQFSPQMEASKPHLGLGPLAFSYRTASELQDEQHARLDAADATHRTLSDTKRLRRSMPDVPNTPAEIKQLLELQQKFLLLTFGHACTLAQDLGRIIVALQSKNMALRSAGFHEVWAVPLIWAITKATTAYFSMPCDATDLQEGNFPGAHPAAKLGWIADHIIHMMPFQQADIPTALKGRIEPPMSAQYHAGPRQNPPPSYPLLHGSNQAMPSRHQPTPTDVQETRHANQLNQHQTQISTQQFEQLS
jgi:hypothetical protein